MSYLNCLPLELREGLCQYLSIDSDILAILIENINGFQSIQHNDKLWIEMYRRNLSDCIVSSYNNEPYIGQSNICQLYIKRLKELDEVVQKYANSSIVQYLSMFFLGISNVNDNLIRFIIKRDYEKVFVKYCQKDSLEFMIKNCTRAARHGAVQIVKMLLNLIPTNQAPIEQVFRHLANGGDYYEFIKYLVEKYNIDVTQNNNEAFNWAAQYGYKNLFEYYLSLGVNPRKDNDRALEYTC